MSVQLKPTALSVPSETIPVIRMESLSVLANDGATMNIDPSMGQIISLPVLPDGALSGIENQNVILARSADGSTIILDASQLTVLPDHTIPIYDGTNFFQVASEMPIESCADTIKPIEAQALQGTGATVQEDKEAERRNNAATEDEIMPPDRGGLYKCAICLLEFPQEKQLRRHFRLHAEDKPHQCEDCEASFNKLTNLVLHQATHRISDPNCPICKKKFSRMASLKSHLMLHEIEENLICTECGDEFSSQFRLNKHVQEHLENLSMDKSFTCRTCNKKFKKLSHLRDHSKIHYKIKASLHRRIYKKNIDRSSFCHKCYFCGKLFQKPSQLLRHNRIHTGERPFKCETCGKAFNQKGAMLIHMVKHTGERPYPCEFCPASFAQKGNLRNHIRRVHSLLDAEGSTDVHKCDMCSCVFRKLGTLNAHMSRAHTSLDNPELPPVDGSFNNPPSVAAESTVATQKNTDSGNSDPKNPFSHVMDELIEMYKQTEATQRSQQQNEETPKQAAVDSNVNSDILQQALENSGLAPNEQQAQNKSKTSMMAFADTVTGTTTAHLVRNIGGVRYYQCMYCSKEFKKPSDLVRHIRIHTHEKPYKCDQCYRAFAVKSTLSAHIRTHLGTKEFQCEQCKKLFATSGSLKVHALLHTGVKPFACSICHKAFRTSGHKNSHLLTHKNGTCKSKRTLKLDELGDINLADIPLPEPILITDSGFMQQIPKNNNIYPEKGSRERPYSCEYCPKGFKKSSHLKQHVRSHTGEKPYKCTQCTRSFVSNGVLKSHLKTHSGVREYYCSICEASFTTNGSVKRHMTIHKEEKPYMCPYCQKTFKTSINCKKHMKTHSYELALGLAAGFKVTVVTNNGESQKSNSNPPAGLAVEGEENNQSVIENVEHNQPAIASFPTPSLVPDSDENTPLDSIDELPQHLSQEVFNTETGVIQQAEVITQAPVDQGHNNGFSLSSSGLADNVTWQLEDNAENILSENLADNSVTQCNGASKNIPKEINENGIKLSRKRKRLKKPYKCLQCSQVFKKSSHLKQHISLHTQERPFRCTTCGKMYRSMASLTCHQQTHDPSQKFPCTVCDRTFKSKRAMMRHMVTHNALYPYYCVYCPEKFHTKELHKDHLRTCHCDLDDEENVDNIAGKDADITVSNNLSVPVSSANFGVIVKEGVATISENQDKWNSLSKENNRDDPEFLPKYPHVCEFCPKSFKKLSDLVRHTRIHTGEKPYACDSCGRCFAVKSSLASHIKTHSGEKNFSCHVCCSLFATKGSLKVHMRLHTGARPFKCSHCDMTFRTSGHRKSHMKSHFKNKSLRSTIKKNKTSDGPETESEAHENQGLIQPEEVVSVPAESVPEVQMPISQDDIQLQIPNLAGQNIQITTIDSTLFTKSFQIDPVILQSLSQSNINIALTQDQLNKLVDISCMQPTLSLDTAPASSATYTINPLIINQLSYQIPVQSEVQMTDSVPVTITDLNLAKSVPSEIFVQGSELVNPQNVALNASVGTKVVNSFGDGSGGTPQYQDTNELVVEQDQSGKFVCSNCFKAFKTAAQLTAHSKTHREKKYLYECQVCDKFFRKKSQFSKHLQIHKVYNFPLD